MTSLSTSIEKCIKILVVVKILKNQQKLKTLSLSKLKKLSYYKQLKFFYDTKLKQKFNQVPIKFDKHSYIFNYFT